MRLLFFLLFFHLCLNICAWPQSSAIFDTSIDIQDELEGQEAPKVLPIFLLSRAEIVLIVGQGTAYDFQSVSFRLLVHESKRARSFLSDLPPPVLF